jgi:colanic acid/amylovoran biosynthesis glycosyltransferase
MRVLFVTWKFPNFANTFILNEIVELLRQGIDVTIASLFPPELDIVHEDVIRFDLLARTLYLSNYARSGDRLPDQLARFLVPSLEELQFCFVKFAERIVDLQISFIHADFANLGATAAMILSNLTGIPYSFEAHSLDLFVKFNFANEKLASASFIATGSEYNRSFLCTALNAPLEKVYVNRICANFRIMDELPKRRKDPLCITSVCRLDSIKGLTFTLSAVDRVRYKHDLRYYIVGKGDEERALRSLAKKLDLGNVVKFCGPLRNGDALSIIQRSSIFLLPCIISTTGDRDGTPTAIAEAMYLETPVISSNICGISEMISHNETGVLTEPGDVDAIEDALQNLLDDSERRDRFAVAGRNHIRELFDPVTNVGRLVALFARHASNPRRPAKSVAPG